MTHSSCDPARLLAALEAAGVTARAVAGRLRLQPASRVPAELLPRLRAAKAELLALLRDPSEEPRPLHPEWAEAQELAARMAADRDRLRSLLMEAGRRRGWPRVQLAPWMAIGAGEEGWQRYLDCPAHGPDEYQRLLAALAR